MTITVIFSFPYQTKKRRWCVARFRLDLVKIKRETLLCRSPLLQLERHCGGLCVGNCDKFWVPRSFSDLNDVVSMIGIKLWQPNGYWRTRRTASTKSTGNLKHNMTNAFHDATPFNSGDGRVPLLSSASTGRAGRSHKRSVPMQPKPHMISRYDP